MQIKALSMYGRSTELASRWFVVSNKDLILDPGAQKFFANRIKATTTLVEGGHDTLIAFPKRVATVIEAASRAAKQ